jgi:hypothetical protein
VLTAGRSPPFRTQFQLSINFRSNCTVDCLVCGDFNIHEFELPQTRQSTVQSGVFNIYEFELPQTRQSTVQLPRLQLLSPFRSMIRC